MGWRLGHVPQGLKFGQDEGEQAQLVHPRQPGSGPGQAQDLGGKGGLPHKAGVIGDMVGDPFKDTAGPSLNILIKLMSMVSIVFASFVVANSLFK